MTSAKAPSRRGRRGTSELKDRLTPAEIDDSFEAALDAVDGDISGIEHPPELVATVLTPNGEVDVVVVPGSQVLPPPEEPLDDLERRIAREMNERSLTAGGKYRPRYTLVEGGLQFDQDVTYAEWERDVLGLIEVKRKIDWALADALAFGEDKFGEGDASNVLDGTPFSVQTLWNLASIARQIPRELRSKTLPFTVQAEVAPLPREQQKELLATAEEKGWKREEMRDEVRKVKRANRRAEAEKLPEPATTPSSIYVGKADARKLPLADGAVNLLLTSPPYGIMDGESGVRKYNTSDDWREWADLMDDFAIESFRVLAEGGRLVLNVPYDTWVGGQNGGQRPTYHRALTSLTAAGFEYVTTINWREGTISKSVARGSVDSPSTVRVINPNEALLVVCKGTYGRLDEAKAKGLTTDLTHDEWLAWTMGDWEIPGESNPWEGFEAAFPLELARRVISLFSFKEDVVCDPFVGSGTSAAACWRLLRTGFFYDLDPKRVASTKRRLRA